MTLQESSQALLCVMDLGSRSSNGYLQNIGNLPVAKPFDFEQHEGDALAFTQFHHGMAQCTAEITLLCCAMGSDFVARVAVIKLCGNADIPAPQEIAGGIGDDPEQPGSERPGGIVLGDIFQSVQKPVLSCVVGVVRVREDRETHPPRLPRVQLNERAERIPVSLPSQPYQFDIHHKDLRAGSGKR